MSTKEEIEQAVDRCERGIATGVWDTSDVGEYRSGKANWIADCALITRAYLSERSERQRRIEAAAAELAAMFIIEPKENIVALFAATITRHLDGETT